MLYLRYKQQRMQILHFQVDQEQVRNESFIGSFGEALCDVAIIWGSVF